MLIDNSVNIFGSNQRDNYDHNVSSVYMLFVESNQHLCLNLFDHSFMKNCITSFASSVIQMCTCCTISQNPQFLPGADLTYQHLGNNFMVIIISPLCDNGRRATFPGPFETSRTVGKSPPFGVTQFVCLLYTVCVGNIGMYTIMLHCL